MLYTLFLKCMIFAFAKVTLFKNVPQDELESNVQTKQKIKLVINEIKRKHLTINNVNRKVEKSFENFQNLISLFIQTIEEIISKISMEVKATLEDFFSQRSAMRSGIRTSSP